MRCRFILHPTFYHISLNVCPLTLPTSLRAVKDSMFEDLLTTMESTLSQSAVLLRSATALSHSLIKGQAPAKILRLEIDDTTLDPDTDYSRQDLDGLLEPCGVVTPPEDSYEGTLHVRERRSSTACFSDLVPPAKRGLSTISSQLGSPSHSPIRFGQIHASQKSPWSDLTSFRSPAASFSDLLSPSKCGVSSVPSPLHSPARLPTPATLNDTWVATDLRTPSLVSPVW